jgi:ribosomal protein S18 acetylase RimI-like enzyme
MAPIDRVWPFIKPSIPTLYNTPPPGNLRPFSAQTDLGELADLLQVAFGDELRRTGNRMVDDMRQIAALGPLGGLAMGAWPLYSGYVWLHEGRIVGNVSFARERDRGEWQLSNVAVDPEMRGLGIASSLVDAALAHLRAHGAQRVFLQVRHDNDTAHTLYARRGFTVYGTVYELGLRPSAWPLTIGGVTGLHPVRWWHSKKLVALAREAIAQDRLTAHPHLLAQYQRTFWQALSGVFAMTDAPSEYGASEGDRLIAWGRLRAEGGRQNTELELLVHPRHRGPWEMALASMLMERLYPQRRPIRAYVSVTHPEVLQALVTLGFERWRLLDEMVLVL